MDRKTEYIIAISALALLIILILMFREEIIAFANSLESIKNYILSFGVLAPIAAILLTTLQVILAPIPGHPFIFAIGYVFGVLPGTLYAMIGSLIGATIVFFIGKRYGKPAIKKLINKKNYKKLELFPQKNKLFLLFVFFLLPFFPDDLLILAAGFSGIRFIPFIIILILGRLPGIIALTLAGAGLAGQDINLTILLIGAICIVLALFYLFSKKFEKKFGHLSVSNKPS